MIQTYLVGIILIIFIRYVSFCVHACVEPLELRLACTTLASQVLMMLQHCSDGLRRRKRHTTIKGKDIVVSGKKSRTQKSEFPSTSSSLVNPQLNHHDETQQILTDSNHTEPAFNPSGPEHSDYDYQSCDTSGCEQSYYARQERSVEYWERIRDDMFKAFMKSSVPPSHWKCAECGSDGAVRCQSCGPFVFYCCECAVRLHKSTNIFHLLEIWKVKLSINFCYYN